MLPSSLGGMGITSLLPTGGFNPAALNVELDIPLAPFHVPAGSAYVRIWGLGLRDIGNAYDLNGADISVYGGMSKGLPLADPSQARLLVKGQILQAFGNWIGTDQSIDLVFYPATGTATTPMNFVLDWQAGTTLASALSNTFATALPTAKQTINLSPRLVLSHVETGYWGTLESMAAVLNPLSKSIITDAGYPGVIISYDGATVIASDLYGPANPATAISFQDLVGQPTWREANVVQIKTVMRGDIDLLDLVTLPQTLITNNAAAFTSFQGQDKNKLTFSGNFNVIAIHHYGNFRQPDANSWATVLDMTPQLKVA